ncbi:LOW QUALITY PROTEIN: hypothetical protein Ct61P_15094 [Colletotrichum tofieldiae]|nr:LOW QUALITY PROTEIN: hypothetical protein Ct61P_15094 [Colletotrichum tofieldiae]
MAAAAAAAARNSTISRLAELKRIDPGYAYLQSLGWDDVEQNVDKEKDWPWLASWNDHKEGVFVT